MTASDNAKAGKPLMGIAESGAMAEAVNLKAMASGPVSRIIGVTPDRPFPKRAKHKW